MTLACLTSLATPPTSMPTDRVESMVSAQQTEYRAAFYREIQMIDYGFAAVGFGQPFHKDRFAHFRILRTARSSI